MGAVRNLGTAFLLWLTCQGGAGFLYSRRYTCVTSCSPLSRSPRTGAEVLRHHHPMHLPVRWPQRTRAWGLRPDLLGESGCSVCPTSLLWQWRHTGPMKRSADLFLLQGCDKHRKGLVEVVLNAGGNSDSSGRALGFGGWHVLCRCRHALRCGAKRFSWFRAVRSWTTPHVLTTSLWYRSHFSRFIFAVIIAGRSG
jgi:hypothetical protein